MTNTFDLVLKKIPFRRGNLMLTAVQMLGPERLEEPAEAAAQGREEEDLRRDRHQGQRVRRLLSQEGIAHGYFRERLGEAKPNPGS